MFRNFKSHYSQTTITSILQEVRYTGLVVSGSFLLTMWNNSEKFVEKFKTDILFLIFFHTIGEIILENLVQQDRSQLTLWCTYVTCRIPNATNTNSHYVLLIAVLLHHCLYQCNSLLHDMYLVLFGVKIKWEEMEMGIKYLFIVHWLYVAICTVYSD
jgi:hypothetical protein